MNNLLTASFLFVASSINAVETNAILNERLESAQASSVEGVDGWRFLPAEIKHLLAGDPSKDPKKPLEAIVDFNEQLKRVGVRLIVVPVPAKATIHPEFLDERLKEEGISPPEAALYEGLRAKGVEVVDLTQEFAGAKSNGPLYCARDTHWNGRAITVAAQELAEMLKDAVPKKLALDAREEPVEIQGDLGGAKETVTLRFVTPQGQTSRIEADRASPILVLGDSHVLVFHDGGDMHAAGAGLPDQLAFELGAPVDVLGVRGSGATPARVSLARRARANPNYLTEKKVIIWCFGARELTQADAWKIVPLAKVQEPPQ
jgi:alginate O-acetyltransferase complex protein AlgJ